MPRRAAGRAPTASCRGRAFSTRPRRSPPPTAASAPVFCLSGQIPLAPDRPRRRPAARDARPARHHAAPDQMGRAHRGAAGRRPAGRRGVRADGDRPAAPGRARDADGRAWRAKAWVAAEPIAALPADDQPEPDPRRSSARPALLNGAERPMIFVGGGAPGREPAGARSWPSASARRWSPAGWARA